MSDFQKISRWLGQIEQSIKVRREAKAALDARIANKVMGLARLARSARPQVKAHLSLRLAKVAEMLESPDMDMDALQDVMEEVEDIYGDQSLNETFYTGREARRGRRAGQQELAEMEALTTYDPENETVDAEWDGTTDQGFTSVLQLLKKAGWENFSELDEEDELEAFESDGDWIDSEDMLDL